MGWWLISKRYQQVSLHVLFFQSRHWRALFIGMGQDYDPTWDFTVADLLSFHLGRYKDLISAICAGAAAEYALELQLNQLARGWEEKDFKLAKHIPLMRPRMEGDQRKSAKGKRKTKKTGHGTEVSFERGLMLAFLVNLYQVFWLLLCGSSAFLNMVINDQNYQKHCFLTLKFCSVEREFVLTNAVIFQFPKTEEKRESKAKDSCFCPRCVHSYWCWRPEMCYWGMM